jgi:hypothetical protein
MAPLHEAMFSHCHHLNAAPAFFNYQLSVAEKEASETNRSRNSATHDKGNIMVNSQVEFRSPDWLA